MPGSSLSRGCRHVTDRPRARKKIEAAGFERFDAVAAMTKAGGDGERALEMLVKGWRPR